MKKIIEYQNLDNEIFQFTKQLETSSEQDNLVKMSALYKNMQTKLKELEESAGKIYASYEEENSKYKTALKQSLSLSKINIDELNETDLKTHLEKANQISSDLFMIERRMNMLLTDINNSLKEFEVVKNKGLIARSKYNESKTKIEAEKNIVEPKIAELKNKLSAMEKGIDKTLLTKYKSLRHDNIFPVFVPLNDVRCGHCRVELPSFKLDKLKNEQYIVCEQCGRLIYSPI